MVDEEKRKRNEEKLKKINELLEKEDEEIIKKRPRAQDLTDEDYELCDGDLCTLTSEYDILIIHDGKAESVNELSPEEIVEKIKEYSRED